MKYLKESDFILIYSMFFLIYLFLAISFELLTNSRCRNIEGNSISPKSADIPILDKRALQF